MLTTKTGNVSAPILMNVDDRMGSCRDKGPGACPGGNAIQWGLRGANRSHPNQDKYKAPSSTPRRPLSLQDPGPQAPQWIGFPDSVVNIHQGDACEEVERLLRSLELLPIYVDKSQLF